MLTPKCRSRTAYFIGLLAGIGASACLVLAFSAPTAQATCLSDTGGCLPGAGYTFDVMWNCGVLASGGTQRCYYDSTLSSSSASAHTFGFGSSDYDGTGTTSVGIDASNSGTTYFGGWGTNLVRACYYNSCDDQSVILLKMSVFQTDSNGAGHTVYGHGEA